MCCCGKPTINGQPGYSWDGNHVGVHPVDPPELTEGDELLFDEPGRCGGIDCDYRHATDSHCHHFRLVKSDGIYFLLVQHGGGNERIRLGSRHGAKVFSMLDSNSRYWLMQMIYHTQQDQVTRSVSAMNAKWQRAAAEKRIKTRKVRNSDRCKVWIEESYAK